MALAPAAKPAASPHRGSLCAPRSRRSQLEPGRCSICGARTQPARARMHRTLEKLARCSPSPRYWASAADQPFSAPLGPAQPRLAPLSPAQPRSAPLSPV
ncbi:hypothetical protein T492DRAFT_1013069 [Pavlovales sp. CCMP2436]|nr:hypothetical protein T492DRAFT_1013069 [Pavlovales sp. CCMP2436]